MLPDDELFNSPADRELASALAGLSPAAASVDSVAAAFEAGRRSGQTQAVRSLWRWRGAAAVLVVGLVGLAVSRGERPSPSEPLATLPTAMPVSPTVAAADYPDLTQSPDSLWQLRSVVLAGGPDGMPYRSPGVAPTISARSTEVP